MGCDLYHHQVVQKEGKTIRIKLHACQTGLPPPNDFGNDEDTETAKSHAFWVCALLDHPAAFQYEVTPACPVALSDAWNGPTGEVEITGRNFKSNTEDRQAYQQFLEPGDVSPTVVTKSSVTLYFRKVEVAGQFCVKYNASDERSNEDPASQACQCSGGLKEPPNIYTRPTSDFAGFLESVVLLERRDDDKRDDLPGWDACALFEITVLHVSTLQHIAVGDEWRGR